MALQKVPQCSIDFESRRLSRRGTLYLYLGRERLTVGETTRENFEYGLRYQLERPWLICQYEDRQYWLFQNHFYRDDEGLRSDDVYALLTVRRDLRRKQVETAKAYVQLGERPEQRRGHIPDTVKLYVYQRDGGRCVNCGQAAELQYDHIIPVARGGGSTAENLQLLCGPCNRRKRDSLVVQMPPGY